ncbi:MAG: PaaI family thioesterase [Acidobacteria bacterium]|nr:PaaI family thioesterase [Acidobacteriota bacterium]
MAPISFQDQMVDNNCFGCGPNNAQGLRIKSSWDGDESICTFHPRPEHSAGPSHVMNGGITATLIDCHSVCTATAHAYRCEGREMDSLPAIWYVTGSLEVQYLAPVPIDQPVDLRARVVEFEGKKTRLECSLSSGGRECARGKVVAIQVPAGWREDSGRQDEHVED